ncbi:MAG: hypothetical protein ACUVUR_06090, partial [bacterium]
MNENALALLNRLSGKNLPFLKAKRTTAGIFSPAHSFFNSASGHNWYLIALVGIFGLSRLIYWMIGVRFNASSLNWFWQYIDPQLLVTNFWRSILYLHSQPPVMNIFLGLILRFFPGWEANAFWLCYLSLGLILTVCLYLLLKNLGILPPIATVLTALFIISPACILYENWLFYTYPVCFLLLFSALFWVKFIKQPKFIYALLFFFSLGFVVLMWSLFHLIWFLAIAGALLTLRRQNYKPIALGFILPFLLVTGWYVKNAILFNQFTASTWFGMNFSKMTNSMLY